MFYRAWWHSRVESQIGGFSFLAVAKLTNPNTCPMIGKKQPILSKVKNQGYPSTNIECNDGIADGARLATPDDLCLACVVILAIHPSLSPPTSVQIRLPHIVCRKINTIKQSQSLIYFLHFSYQACAAMPPALKSSRFKTWSSQVELWTFLITFKLWLRQNISFCSPKI